jgi:phage shock protein PspC (stress-responsive transcriptional regulator)
MQKRLQKSRTNVVLTGTLAGIAEYFGIDPTIVRVHSMDYCVHMNPVPLLELRESPMLTRHIIQPVRRLSRNLRKHKSRTNVVLTGTLAGIAEYFGIDPTIVRVIYVFLSFGLIYFLIVEIFQENTTSRCRNIDLCHVIGNSTEL